MEQISREGDRSDYSRKEVIQPHLPVQLPCYDFVPVTSPTFDGCLLAVRLTDFRCYQLP